MSFNNFQKQPQQPFYQNQNVAPMQQNQFQQQNVQPLFPQPQGNVYNINSTLEVANVPVGAGISVALCLNEGVMYIKTMQNGNPMFWAYRILPYDSEQKTSPPEESSNKEENPLAAQFEQVDNRFVKLEKQVNDIQESLKKDKGEWKL